MSVQAKQMQAAFSKVALYHPKGTSALDVDSKDPAPYARALERLMSQGLVRNTGINVKQDRKDYVLYRLTPKGEALIPHTPTRKT